jgi:hypothetical protein
MPTVPNRRRRVAMGKVTGGQGFAGQRIIDPAHPYAFRPYVVPHAPAGTYDPNLDIQVSAAGRGLQDLTQDVATQGVRDTSDYLTGVGGIQQGQQREGQDYDSRVNALTRAYDQLHGRQAQQQAAAGVDRGGAVLQAAAKRAANMALDRQPIDVSHTRAGEDSTRQLDALGLELAPPSADSPLGGRRFQDRGTQLVRAQREGAQFGIDTQTVKDFQGTQSGLFDIPGRGEPGGMPKNERIGPDGQHYKIVVTPTQRLTVSPAGQVLSRRPRRKR